MARLPSVMSHSFSQVPRAQIPRSSFDRSFGHKTTLDCGYLVPVFVDEALPGDTFSVSMTVFARLATPMHPFMDNLFCNSFFFFVPYRLLWDNWQRFNGEQDNPGDSTDYQFPSMQPPTGGYQAGSIYDHMNLPVGIEQFAHTSLPLRAYNLIWNQWFRDQNLQDAITVPKGDTNDDPSLYQLMRRGKRHDYFTSSLPWPQKGPGVDIPLGTQAPVVAASTTGSMITFKTVGDPPQYSREIDTAGPIALVGSQTSTTTADMFADLSQATAATINQLRQAFQLQKLYERDARGGTRYTEIIRAHFNVVSPDARLQRAEYLGGGQSPINLYSVPQTSGTPADLASGYTDTPQANLAAYGTLSTSGHGFTKSFTEHGVVIGLVSVRADLNYQQGLNRMWSRKTKFDFFWPALAHIGEQAVLNKEIMTQGAGVLDQGFIVDEQVFGYQERYAEYRYKPSEITGQFRSSFAQSLDTWHLAQDFATLPKLNQAFIEDNPPVQRVLAVPTEPHLIWDSYFRFRAARPMPVYGVPGNIDRF